MASQSPRSTPNKRSRGAGDGEKSLPLDIVVSEILIRLPPRTLCRLRAVCRQWRSDLTDPAFVRAHASRHPALHLVTLDGGNVDVLDMAGNVVRRIPVVEAQPVPRAQRLDPVVLVDMPKGGLRLLNLATGAASSMPGHDDGGSGRLCFYWPYYSYSHDSFACGQVPSTGDYKVLRIARSPAGKPGRLEQTCDILTITSSDGVGPWRRRQNPPVHVCQPRIHDAIVDGVVYFLPGCQQKKQEKEKMNRRPPEPDLVLAAFDLEREEWTETTLRVLVAADDLTLTQMNGSLVTIHRNHGGKSVDLWFLRDAEKGLWVKEYSIRHGSVVGNRGAKPLMVMNDGTIIVRLFLQEAHLLIFWAYDPRTNVITCVLQVPLRERSHVLCTYPGSLLCL